MKIPRTFIWLIAIAMSGLAAAQGAEWVDEQEAEQGAADAVEKVIEEYLVALRDKKQGTQIMVHLESLGRFYTDSMDEIEQIQLQLDREQGKKSELKIRLRNGERLRAQLSAEVWKAFRFRSRINDMNKKIWAKAVWVFGRMPEHGCKYLWKAFEDKRFRKDSKMQAQCIVQIGKTKDYSQYEELIDLLKHHDDQVIAAAAKAMGQFGGAPGKIRWECTKELVKRFEAFENDATGGGSSSAGATLGWTKGPMMRALEALTGQTRDNSLGWTRFWNKNKKNKSLWKN